jgi:hypothetical protein
LLSERNAFVIVLTKYYSAALFNQFLIRLLALPGYYGVYTEVSYFSDWIAATIAANAH